MKLINKVALVTGGAAGIGEAVVRRFVAEGATVIFTDMDAMAGKSLSEELNAVFQCRDVTSEPHWLELMEYIRSTHGELHILVNNAGIISNQAIDQVELDCWEKIMKVNVTGPMLGCREAIKLMQCNDAPNPGSIINISSTVALLGLSNDTAYTTSKAAVVGLTRSVAAWCAKNTSGIRCNSVHPGATATAILQDQIEQHPELEGMFRKMSPMNRMADPHEIANLVLYLASDESSYSTGGQFVADGGLTSTHPSMDL